MFIPDIKFKPYKEESKNKSRCVCVCVCVWCLSISECHVLHLFNMLDVHPRYADEP